MCHPQICMLKLHPPNVTVLGDGAFAKELRLNEVRGWGPCDEISAFATGDT